MEKQNLDQHTDQYLEFLRKRSELEMRLLREHAGYDPENPERNLELVREREAAVRELMHMDATFGAMGEGSNRLPWSGLPSSEFGGEFSTGRAVICNFEQQLNVEDATYCEPLSYGDFDRAEIGPRTAKARVSDKAAANKVGHVRVCFDTNITVPAADGVTSVSIQSVMMAHFRAVLVEATGPDSSVVRALPFVQVSGSFGQRTVPGDFMVNELVINDTFTLSDMASVMKAVIPVSVSVPAGSGETLQVRQTMTLEAQAPGGSANIGGDFYWEPLAVRMSEGCRLVQQNFWP